MRCKLNGKKGMMIATAIKAVETDLARSVFRAKASSNSKLGRISAINPGLNSLSQK